MSSYAELYVSEDVADFFKKELNEKFGTEWYFDTIPFMGINDISSVINIDVLNYDEEKIGEVEVHSISKKLKNDFGYIYLDWYPKKILITKVSKVVKYLVVWLDEDGESINTYFNSNEFDNAKNFYWKKIDKPTEAVLYKATMDEAGDDVVSKVDVSPKEFKDGGEVNKKYKVDVKSYNYANTLIHTKYFDTEESAKKFASQIDSWNDDGYAFNIYGYDKTSKKIKIDYFEYDDERIEEIKKNPKYKLCDNWELEMEVLSSKKTVIFSKNFDSFNKAKLYFQKLEGEDLFALINGEHWEENEEYKNGGNVGRDWIFKSKQKWEQDYDRKREYKEYKKEGWFANWFKDGGEYKKFKDGGMIKEQGFLKGLPIDIYNALSKTNNITNVEKFESDGVRYTITTEWSAEEISNELKKVIGKKYNISIGGYYELTITEKSDLPTTMFKNGGEADGYVENIPTETLEVMIGRKLNGWNDNKVIFNGIVYKKCFMKPYYKIA